jgi:ferredoxin-NADP reductase
MPEQGAPAASPPRRPVYRARVERIRDHNADTRSLFLGLIDGGQLGFVPGQFISISLALENETRVRPYTVASNPEERDAIEICFNQVPGGVGVRYLFERKVGDELQFTGPFGAFTMDRVPEAECVFIAEGTAIAPIRPMLQRAQAASHAPMFLLYAASDRAHILYSDELEGLAARDANFHFGTMLEGGDIYDRLHDEVNRRWITADTNRARQFFICGVGKGVIRIRDLLRSSGYERRAVHYEQW